MEFKTPPLYIRDNEIEMATSTKIYHPQLLLNLIDRISDRLFWAGVDWSTLEGEDWNIYAQFYAKYLGLDCNAIAQSDNGNEPVFLKDVDGEYLWVGREKKPLVDATIYHFVLHTTSETVRAILTARLKSKLHHLAAPNHISFLSSLSEPSFAVQPVLPVNEGFSLTIFSRPPPNYQLDSTPDPASKDRLIACGLV